MLELNGSFLIQLVNFLLLMFFLSHFLFKPVLQMVEKRNKTLDTFRTEAQNLNERAEKIFADYNAKTSDLKKENSSVLAASRQLGMEEQDRIVKEAREKYHNTLESGLADVEKLIAKVRTELKSEAQKLSHMMASILAGRTV
jgi:F-type H+-transporting ATPase subunit b